MITAEGIKELVEKQIRGTGAFLVEVKVKPGNVIRIHLDSPEGITIEACADISRHIHRELDREVEDYSLEVSSPGIGSPFRVKQQYEKNMGHAIDVLLLDGNRLRGILKNVSDGGILLDMKGNERELQFKDIKTTKEIITFN